MNLRVTRPLVTILLLCASAVRAEPIDPGQSARPSRPAAGYLTADERPDSSTLLPAPPAPGSAAAARDEAATSKALALRGSQRWMIARQDAELKLPHTLDSFSCALGTDLAAQPSPRLTALLGKALPDIAYSTFAAKDKYRRNRPFTVDGGPICTPEIEEGLRKDGSYPSGHSAIGWGIALLLAELAPDRANASLSRGRAFDQSRVVCNVHWLSDVEEGRIMAAATIARLHANPQFRADMIAAGQELSELRKTAQAPQRDCAVEAKVLSEDGTGVG